MGGNNQQGSCAATRRQNLLNEFQGLLQCIDESRPASAPMMCIPCPSQPAVICLPKCPTHGSGGNSKEQEEQKIRDQLESLPRITECGTFEIRPTEVMRIVKDQHSADVQYMNIHVLNDIKKKQQKQGSQSSTCPRQQQKPQVCMLPECPPALQPTTQQKTGVERRPSCAQNDGFRPTTAPISVQHYMCVPCPIQENKNRLSREMPRPKVPSDFFELRGGVFQSVCECNKRNGLQHDCPFTQCRGKPPCLVKPEPDCLPSGGTGLQRPPPRVSNYPYVAPDCEPREPRERTFPKPDACHRAGMDCEKCPPVLMCRPVCEKGRESYGQQCPRPQSRNIQQGHGGAMQVRMCPEFASARDQQMNLQSVDPRDSACPSLRPMYQMCKQSPNAA